MMFNFSSWLALFWVIILHRNKVNAEVSPGDLNNVAAKLDVLVSKLNLVIDKWKSVRGPSAQPGTALYASLKMTTLLGKKYFINDDELLTYSDAYEWCRKKGLQLVSIETEKENVALASALILPSPAMYWTSGNDLERLFFFVWRSTRQPFTFTNWYPGDPNNLHGEQCVAVGKWYTTEFGWLDLSCDLKLRFVCEEP